MTTFKIVDASVAIKWFLVNEEKREEALNLLDEIQSAPHYFAVPELFFNEMLAVFCKAESEASKIKRYLYAIENLGFHRLGNGSELLNTAAEIAVKYKLSAYDAVYAASAKVMDGLWITADLKAHKRIARLKISQAL
ncbi:MAG TPA: type II toxin-antitoxin system VapC family toxin [Myxococcota bacterium]|nr:type II toxin-antitoxin system VapC family toxin [Myxococcota bacterium]